MTRRADRRRFAIVGVLAEHGPTSGFDLCLILHRPSGTIYPDLAALEHEGRIVADWTEVDVLGPRRRLYRLSTDDERHGHRRRREQLEAAKQVGRTRPLRVVPKPAIRSV